MNLEKEVYVVRKNAGHSEMKLLCSHRDYVTAFNELACILVGWAKHTAIEQKLVRYTASHFKSEPGDWGVVPGIPCQADADFLFTLAQHGSAPLAVAVGQALRCIAWPSGTSEIKGMTNAMAVMQLMAELACGDYVPVVQTGGSKATSLRLRWNEASKHMLSHGFKAGHPALIEKILHEFEHSYAFVAATLIPEVSEKLLCVECGCDVSGFVQEHKPGCSFFPL